MEKKEVILLGGGGHCKSIIDAIESLGEYTIAGIVDIEENIGEVIYGVTIIGKDDDLKLFYNKGIKHAFIAVGSIGDVEVRKKLYNKAKEVGFEFPFIRDASSIIARNVVIEEGVFIGKGVIINSDTSIKANAIINSGAILEHDCKVEEFVHIGPGATICGGVSVGYATHIGCNATVIQGVKIGRSVLIGAGSVVTKNVNDSSKVVGNPCREV